MKCGVVFRQSESRCAFKIHFFGVIYPIAYGEVVVPQGYTLLMTLECWLESYRRKAPKAFSLTAEFQINWNSLQNPQKLITNPQSMLD